MKLPIGLLDVQQLSVTQEVRGRTMEPLETFLDLTIAALECYEPSGQRVKLIVRDLLGHSLVCGSTGSGKSTSVVHPLLEQLIRFRSEDYDQRVALVVVDLKGDGEVEQLLRNFTISDPDRLVVLSEQTDSWIDPFEPLRTRGLSGLEAAVERIGAGVPEVRDNAYWHTVFYSLIRQVLATLSLSEPDFTVEAGINLLSSQLLGGTAEGEMQTRFDQIEERVHGDPAGEALLQDLERTQAMWRILDGRTRSNFMSMATTVINPLRAAATRPLFFGNPVSAVSIRRAIEQGKIVLLKMNGFSDSEAASFVSKMVKADFYEALAEREGLTTARERLAGLVVDEWSMIASGGAGRRSDDLTALQMIRSKGGFVVAATQSLAAIDMRLGPIPRRAALANFGNLFLMRSREEELELFARRAFGKRTIVRGKSSLASDGEVGWSLPTQKQPVEQGPRRYVVDCGALARLEAGQAYVSIGPKIFPEPVWMVPRYVCEEPW